MNAADERVLYVLSSFFSSLCAAETTFPVEKPAIDSLGSFRSNPGRERAICCLMLYFYGAALIVIAILIRYRDIVSLVLKSVWESVDEYNSAYTSTSDHED